MKRPAVILTLLLAFIGLTPLFAQGNNPLPLGGELDLSSDAAQASSPAVADDAYGRFLVTWRTQSAGGDSVRARIVRRAGAVTEAQPEFTVKPVVAGVTVSAPSVAMDSAGRATIVWGEARATETCVRTARYDPIGRLLPTLTLAACTPASGAALVAPQVAAGANVGGEVALVWTRRAGDSNQALVLRTISPAGVLRDTAPVEPHAGSDPRPGVAVGGGQVAVVWQQVEPGVISLFERRFDILGAAHGPRLPLTYTGSLHPSVAASRNGQIAALWVASDYDILGQIYLPDGTKRPRGGLEPMDFDDSQPPFQVFRPVIASDRVGGLATFWESDRYDDEATAIVGRMFNQLGDQQSPIIVANTEGAGAQHNPAVSLADDGQFLVAWETPPAGADTVQHVHAALFRQPHDDDACVYRGGTFLCEFLGARFLAAPIPFGAGRSGGDVPLLGDVDGDGRADPCVRRGGDFLCNLSHAGGKVEWHDRFGAPGVPALLGDVDGNGTADPCVRSGRTFLCDTNHNGGSAEFADVFGLAADVPVLGDVDGDGRADPCVFRAAIKTFLCDTRHDGTRGLTFAIPALPGDRPLLGDVDGDGRADFCLARGARLFCDGRTPAFPFSERLLASRPSDWLLLGNVDGM